MPMKPSQTKSPSAKSEAAKAARAAKALAAGKTPKPARAKPATAKPAPIKSDEIETPALELAEDQAELEAPGGQEDAKAGQGTVKLKDLIDQVAETLGAKRQDVKPVVEATLARMGAALGRGDSLNLQGFGNLKVAKAATTENPVMRLKLRLTEGGKAKVPSGEED